MLRYHLYADLFLFSFRQVETAGDKLTLIKGSKDREIKDLKTKLTDASSKLKV